MVGYRDTKDRFIIAEVDEIIIQLEDNSMSIQTMMGSKHVNEIRDEVEEWEKKLGLHLRRARRVAHLPAPVDVLGEHLQRRRHLEAAAQ